LEPKLRGSLAADKEHANFENGEITAEQRAARIRQLNVQYGPKKSIIQVYSFFKLLKNASYFYSIGVSLGFLKGLHSCFINL
jgi:hypothetical protein